MGNRRKYLIDNIVRICQKLDQKGFTANHDGNISVRFEDKLLATPTSMSKAEIVSDMIITLDMNGNKIEGIGKPFSEIKLHLAAYRAREDAMSVVHAHPPIATARGLAGKPLKPNLPEAVVSIGDEIPVAEYAMPGAKKNDEIVAAALEKADVFMMQGNGVLSIGTDIEQAYLRLELVEHLAKIDFYTSAFGKTFELPENDVTTLLEKRASIGLGPKAKTTETKELSDPIRAMIAEEIRRVLK